MTRQLLTLNVTFSIAFLTLCPFYAWPAEIRDDFNAGNDSNWTHLEPLASSGAPGSFTFPNGGYRIQANASPDPATLGPARAGSLRFDLNTANFYETYDLAGWNNSLNQSIGVLGRAANPGFGTTTGYAFTYSTAGFISISLLDREHLTTLTSQALSLDATNTYRFEFEGIGRALTGLVYNDRGSAIAGLSAVDNTYAQGVTGFYLFSNVSDGTADATFDNFRALTIVPEPSTVNLTVLGLGGFLFLAPRRRRQKRSQL